jgi:predicted N-acetyltransferase YhbS
MSIASHIETLDCRTLTEPDARAISELLCAVWPKPGRTVDSRTVQLLSEWRDHSGPEEQHPRCFVVRESGRMIAHSGAYPRTIGTQEGELTILALARVCTDPAARGRQLGAAVVRETFKLVDDGTFPWSLFQTSHHVRPFYEKFGACLVHNRIVNSLADDPTANPFWDEIAMRYPGRPGWPVGEIDLRGPGY